MGDLCIHILNCKVSYYIYLAIFISIFLDFIQLFGREE